MVVHVLYLLIHLVALQLIELLAHRDVTESGSLVSLLWFSRPGRMPARIGPNLLCQWYVDRE